MIRAVFRHSFVKYLFSVIAAVLGVALYVAIATSIANRFAWQYASLVAALLFLISLLLSIFLVGSRPSAAEPEGTAFYTQQSNPSKQAAVRWRLFPPPQASSDGLVVLFPGWMHDARSSWCVSTLARAYAREARTLVCAITIPGCPLDDQAQAAADHLRASQSVGLAQSVVLIGHSEGGIRAIKTTAILEKSPPAHVHGVILLNSVGFIDRRPFMITVDFIQDALGTIPRILIDGLFGRREGVLRRLWTAIGAGVDYQPRNSFPSAAQIEEAP